MLQESYRIVLDFRARFLVEKSFIETHADRRKKNKTTSTRNGKTDRRVVALKI